MVKVFYIILLNFFIFNFTYAKDISIGENLNLEFIEIGRKGYKKTLSDEDIRNGLYFKLQLNDLKANLKKQFVKPINYNCS